MSDRAAIELAPDGRASRRRVLAAVQRGAAWLHLALALALVLAVFLQVYLIGSYIFGAGQRALDAHRAVGFGAHGLAVLILAAALVARLPRRDLLLSLLLAAIGTVQVSLAGAHRWVGGLHPLLALVVLGLAALLALRGRRRQRRRGGAGSWAPRDSIGRTRRFPPQTRRPAPGAPRLLVAAVVVLVVLDLAGGLIAIVTDLNDVGEAWSTEAGLAVPWPIILLQLALTAVAVLGRRRFAIAAALLLTAACAVSVMSGLFDGDLFAEGLGPGAKAFQIVLVSWMALVGLLAALRTTELLRMRGELEASM